MTTLTYECRGCRKHQRAAIATGQTAVQCGDCQHEIPLRAEWIEGSIVRACALCGTTDLYVQKDFPHRLGLTIVFAGIVLSSLAWANYWYLAAIGVLMATAVLDLLLYYIVGDVLVCYRCLAQYRGTERTTQHQAFDLAIGERYRQERMRLEQLRNKHN